MPHRDVVVCSFHTPDEYYAGHARELKEQLDSLGVGYELLEVEKHDGEDWADVTRRKIGFIHGVCQKHPDALVIWIDVDCRITHLPDYVRDTTADFIGFQRSFRSPMQIGYANRTRFWEPSFWGVNATPLGRKLIDDAYALEQRSDLKATDDYFLEEAWRANAHNLTFQMISSTAIVREDKEAGSVGRPPFFVFGSSGNVADFKGKVVQHGGKKKVGPRKKMLAQAKRLEAALPDDARQRLRRISDQVGITGALTADAVRVVDPVRQTCVGDLLSAGMNGDPIGFAAARKKFDNAYIVGPAEDATFEVAEAFLEYSARDSPISLRLAWWVKPFPGNFGDWLSPLAVSSATGANILFQKVTDATKKTHIVAMGSIGRFIKPSSVVVGTGVSTTDLQLATKATYVSLRGPIAAKVLRASGGPAVTAYGDPGLALSRFVPLERGATNGRVAFVRHFTHRPIPMQLPEHVDELDVRMSRRADIEAFLGNLVAYDYVITSAMHVMIACQSYGIPCGLVTFEGFEDSVHGEGVKYEDYALGAGVEVQNPQAVPLDLRRSDLSALVRDIRVEESKKDEVQEHLRTAVAKVLAAAPKKKSTV